MDGLRSRWSIAQRRMGPCRIVMDPPCLDHDACLGEGMEDLAIEQLVAELRVEALAVAGLPGTARFDERRLRSHCVDPVPHGRGDELRPVIRSDVTGHAAQDEEVSQNIYDRGRVQLPVDPNGQAFPRELVDDVEHSEFPPVVRPALDEVVGPDVVRPLRAKTDARPVIQPEAAFLRLLLRHLQPLLSPYPLDPLHIHRPAGISRAMAAIRR